MKIKVIRIQQNGKSLFLTNLPVKMLRQGRIAQWDPSINESNYKVDDLIRVQGYQRAPIRTHYTKIGKYVAENKDALLPTAVLANCLKPLSFSEDPKDSNFGTIEIDDKTEFDIVDGQHRVYGLIYAVDELGLAEIDDFELPVVFMDQIGKVEEMRHFFLVNSTQKKVRTDLAERLLRLLALKDSRVMNALREKDKDWKLRAVKIIDMLLNDQNSIWHKRIKRPNEVSRPDAVASEGSFSTSLRPVLVNEFAMNEGDEVVISWINSFWNALRELMPEAFVDPKQYVIQKTPGIYTLHMVFPSVLYICSKVGDISKQSIINILKKDPDHFQDSDFWISGGEGAAHYNSVGAFRILASEIKERLK